LTKRSLLNLFILFLSIRFFWHSQTSIITTIPPLLAHTHTLTHTHTHEHNNSNDFLQCWHPGPVCAQQVLYHWALS
jgi:hypothetical protein